MFTIKHIDSRGNEFAIEAESYEVQYDHPADLVRVMTYANQYRDGCYTGLFAGKPSDHRGPDTDSIYVMNSHGSTVAKHHFFAPTVHPGSPDACAIGDAGMAQAA